MDFELVVTCVGIVVGGKSSLLTGRLPTKGAVTSVAAISVTKSPGITDRRFECLNLFCFDEFI